MQTLTQMLTQMLTQILTQILMQMMLTEQMLASNFYLKMSRYVYFLQPCRSKYCWWTLPHPLGLPRLMQMQMLMLMLTLEPRWIRC